MAEAQPAPLSLAHLRRAARRRHRQAGARCRAGCTACATTAALLFIDLRDHYGMTQVVADPDSPAFKTAETLRSEWVIRVDGKVRERPDGHRSTPTCRPARSRSTPPRSRCCRRPRSCRCRCSASPTTRRTCASPTASSICAARPCTPIIMKRLAITRSIRRRMHEAGFNEFPTPILTASSPGGRARLPGAVAHPCRQVLRAAAGAAAVQAAADGVGLRPLFPDRALLPRRGPARRPAAGRVLPARRRDELRRAGGRVRDHGAGHHAACSRSSRRRQGRSKRTKVGRAFPTTTAIAKYGSDKPDLRNPIEMPDVTEHFRGSGFKVFAGMIEKDPKVRVWAIPAPPAAAARSATA